MDIETKKLVDKRDFRALKYLFVDALDVDPTFARFEEDYQYCREFVSELWEPYQELTPLRSDPKEWNEDYWVQLKVDLAKNFSDERLAHMRKVAMIVLAEKVRRIQAERAARETAANSMPQTTVPTITEKPSAETPQEVSDKKPPMAAEPELSQSEKEQRRIKEKERQLAEENRKHEEACAAAARRREAEKERLRQEREKTPSKKGFWIVVAAVAVAVVIVLLITQSNPN